MNKVVVESATIVSNVDGTVEEATKLYVPMLAVIEGLIVNTVGDVFMHPENNTQLTKRITTEKIPFFISNICAKIENSK
jgi:hypothetical protein